MSDTPLLDKNDIEKFQDYHPKNRDLTTRGICCDNINAVCLFSDVITTKNLGFILYHEIGHLIDYYTLWKNKIIKPDLSTKKEFIEAYKKDITKYWSKIKNDNRFRLKHYIQNSTPKKPSTAGLMETFASCFGRINNKFDDIDILGEYFENTLLTAKMIYSEFLSQW